MSEPPAADGQAAEPTRHGPPTITAYPDGPFIVRGAATFVAPDGTVVMPRRRTVALCRCGASAIKPWCDGTHKLTGFRDASPAS